MHQNFGAPEKTEIIGVRFRDTGKVYYFSPQGITAKEGDHVVVETARGLEFGEVMIGNKQVPTSEIVPPLRPVLRIANQNDFERHEANIALEKNAFDICLQKIRDHKLEMKLIDAEYTFDNNKLLFYFSAEGRVDFRELVKDLASVFRTRIELRQIGIRDEAKMMGGIGVCGRPFCCSTFLSDFAQVSIKMAKEQNLSLNSAKISGTCGRLMCCLNYEYQTYEEELRLTPPVGSRVKTPDGAGTVTEITPLTGMLKVSLTDKQGNVTFRQIHRDEVTVLKMPEKKSQEKK
ncbi:MAG: stage 0 sporulation family protein [Clostridia bacterium]|nr:stage 0 sporulation family protein [Clostridia bacterium]